MAHDTVRPQSNLPSRRDLVRTIGLAAGAALAAPRVLSAQNPPPQAPPSTVTNPPRDFGPGAPPTTYFNDPDIVVVDPMFANLIQRNSAITRLWTGALWTEGPAWSGVGRFLVFSDIPNNRQMRWIEDDGRVTLFRAPSNNSNGNTFDFQGRQLSCEHLTRRVVRYELDGAATVIADSFDGKRLNSPNDVVPHPDGSYWFTDPPFGASLYEGQPDIAGGPANASGRLNPRLGQPPEAGSLRRELPTAVYRVDPKGRVEQVASENLLTNPNGLAFSPDHKRLYVVSSSSRDLRVFDVGADNKLTNHRVFADFRIDGVACGPDGVRCDVDGNVWCSSNAGRAVGYSGVTVWTPEGKLVGRIRLPEVCGNLCFGGPKRNRLFMVASQSLYAVYLNTQGAAPS
jgi:gluconolactonase